MAFFEKLGESISSKSKDVVKKAKDLAEVTNLNGQINTQEEVINKTYMEIGKAYYEAHKDSVDDQYATQFLVINAALDKIKELRDEICQIKGVQNCPNCGFELPLAAAFCTYCGTAIPARQENNTQTTEETHKVCPECNTVLGSDAVFCTICGHKLS